MPLDTPLDQARHAVHNGDVVALRRLLETNADLRASINEPVFAFDSPALVAVAGRGDVALVDVLLEFGADPNRKSSWWAGGFHPLYGARGAVAQRLLEAGAIPDACAAAHLDRVDLLEKMLAADPTRVHERGGDGQTPLHFASSRRVVDLLLDAGADIDARDVDHRSTPAEWMLGDRDRPALWRIDLARYLVERGAHCDIFMAAALGLTDRAREMARREPAVLDLRTGQGEYGEKPPSSFHIYMWTIGANLTPLQVAAKFGHEDTVRALAPLASPAQRLLVACHLGREAEARAIVREHPHLVASLNVADRRALTDEAWAGNARAVALMLALGFDPAERLNSGPTGGTALHAAAWCGSAESVAALLEDPRGRALINSRDDVYQGTPLNWCSHGSRNSSNASAPYGEVARLLLAAGAEIPADYSNASADVQKAIRAFQT